MRPSPLLLLLAASFACVTFVACATTETVFETVPAEATSAARDAGASPRDAAVDAPRRHVTPPALPVVPNQGGPILATPEIITITWSGDPIATQLEAFDAWWVKSATWKTMMAEWGVGAGKYVGAVRLPSAAPPVIDESGVAALLRTGFAAGTIPAPNGSRLYMIYPPAGTVATLGGTEGCSGFQAYHSSVDVPAGDAGPATKAYYSMTPRCADTAGFSALDHVTWGASHEVMEAASDPQFDHPAWRIDDQSLAAPELGENADLCAGHPVMVEGHLITRNWSNVAAKAGARPCVPAPAGPMFGLFAEPGEITITPGKTVVVKIRAYASGTFPSFSVFAYASDPALTAKLSTKTAADGDELSLTLTASADFVEQPGENLVFLFAQTPQARQAPQAPQDYRTKRHLIVHARP